MCGRLLERSRVEIRTSLLTIFQKHAQYVKLKTGKSYSLVNKAFFCIADSFLIKHFPNLINKCQNMLNIISIILHSIINIGIDYHQAIFISPSSDADKNWKSH